MFRKLLDNNHIEVRFAKNTKPSVIDDTTTAVDSEEVSRIAKNLVKYTAVAGVVVMTAGAVLHTLSEIAIIATKAGIDNKEND
jgi:ABC-type transport system involved in cytochrome c biogenesis ATPase subunit